MAQHEAFRWIFWRHRARVRHASPTSAVGAGSACSSSRLLKARCARGKVTGRTGGRVSTQSRKAGTRLRGGTKVAVKLTRPKPKRRSPVRPA